MNAIENSLTSIAQSFDGYSDYATFSLHLPNDTSAAISITMRSICERIMRAALRTIHEIIFYWFGINLNLSSKEQDQQGIHSTITYLEQIFGQKRLQRAAQAAEINFDLMKQEGYLMTKGQLRAIYSHLAMVQTIDFEELLNEIHFSHSSTFARQGVAQQALLLQEQFRGINSLNACSKENIGQLHALLMPFASIEDMSFSSPLLESIELPFFISKNQMLARIAYAVETLRRKVFRRPDWEFYFGKKLAQPEFPSGIIVAHPEGYIRHTSSISNTGITKLFFESIGTTPLEPHILYRGTRVGFPSDSLFDTYHTVREDFTDELGAYGAMRTYEETQRQLSSGKKYCLIGYSLGGAHAQRDSVLFFNSVSRLSTVSSPGIDNKTTELFAKLIETLPDHGTRMQIDHASDPEDIVDAAGESHIGAGCSNRARITVRSYIPMHHPAALGTMFPDKLSLLQSAPLSLMMNLINVPISHCRATSGLDHRCLELSNDTTEEKEMIEKILAHDVSTHDHFWERLRKRVCIHFSPGFARFAIAALMNRGISLPVS